MLRQSLLKKWDHRWRAPRMDKNKTSIVWSSPGGFQFQVSNFRLYKSVSECNSQFPIPLPSFRIPLPVSQYHVPVSEHHCVVSEYHSEYHFQFPNPSFRIPPPVSEYHSPVSDYHRDLVGCNERRPEWSIGTKSLLRCFTDAADAASHCDSFWMRVLELSPAGMTMPVVTSIRGVFQRLHRYARNRGREYMPDIHQRYVNGFHEIMQGNYLWKTLKNDGEPDTTSGCYVREATQAIEEEYEELWLPLICKDDSTNREWSVHSHDMKTISSTFYSSGFLWSKTERAARRLFTDKNMCLYRTARRCLFGGIGVLFQMQENNARTVFQRHRFWIMRSKLCSRALLDNFFISQIEQHLCIGACNFAFRL